jgi:glycine oxidase
MRVGIIGQGFAGTALAWRAHWAGHQLYVFDQGLAQSASWVAAGIVNPLVLKRKRLVQEAHAHIAAFSPFYDRVERETGLSVRYSGEIHEVLSDAATENAWASLGAERGFEPFIGPIRSVSDPRIQASATASVHHSARLRAQTYLSASREFFAAQHSVREEVVDSLEYQNGAWRVNDIEDLEVVLLAEGVQARWTNQYFGELPFAPTKGEGLKIRWEGPEVPVALHKNVFLLPDGDGSYQAGSTYAWEGLDEGPTEKARAEILEKLRGWFDQEVEVLDHWTGVRPTMRDRQPVFGWHSELPGLGYLNGLGSRGALTSPLLSDRLWGLHPGRTSQKS